MSEQPRISSEIRADGVLLVATVGWAVTFAIVKDALADASPAAFLTARFAIGTLAALVLARRSLRDLASLRYGALLGLLLWGGFALNTIGLQFTTATRSGFLTDLCVVLVPLFGAAMFRQRPHLASWFGAACAAGGLVVLTAPAPAAGDATGAQSLLGDGLTLGSAVLYALHILFTGRFAPKVKPSAAVVGQLAVCTLLSAAMLPFEAVRFDPTPRLVGTLLFCGVCASALFIYLQIWAQARTTAVRAALIFTLEPVLAAFFARLFLGEPLGRETWLGGALIVLGIVVAELWPRLEARRTAAVGSVR